MVETAVYLPDILKILGWGRSKYKKNRRSLHNSGAIYYDIEGSPPQKRVKAFPSRLQRYLTERSLQNFHENQPP